MQRARLIFTLFTGVFLSAPHLVAHPGSGIVADRHGQVYFVDTGIGVWKIDLDGALSRHAGPAYHWMTIDHDSRFTQEQMPRVPDGEVVVAGADPSLILSSDFPLTIGADGALYYPHAGSDGRVRIMRLTPSGDRSLFTVLPAATEVGPGGEEVQATWIHGLTAGPDGSLYYAERDAVRRITPDGTVSLVVASITVPDCVRPPAATEKRLGPLLRDLEIAPDGTIYVAASGCSALLKITQEGTVSVVLRGSDAWSPMGVALWDDDLFVLEYRYIQTARRVDWLPRVRKVLPDGTVTVAAAVEHR